MSQLPRIEDKILDFNALQKAVADLERGQTVRKTHGLDHDVLDSALQGGLERGALHELTGAGAMLWLSQLKISPLSNWVWLSIEKRNERAMIIPYGAGIKGASSDGFGLNPQRLLWVQLWDAKALCQVAGEILGDEATSLLIIACHEPLSLSTARKLHLAARQSNSLCFILDMRFSKNQTPICSNAMTRWAISLNDDLSLLVKLIKNRYGMPVQCKFPIEGLKQDLGLSQAPALSNNEGFAYG
jgi:hypothetical protein